MTENPPPPTRELPPLDSEPEERRRIRPWHLALVGALIGYPLSVGPVAWLCETFDPTMKYTAFVRVAYAPIRFFYKHLPPVRPFYDWYLDLFGTR